MNRKKSGSQSGLRLGVLYVLLVGAVATYALPLLKVNLPPVGEKSWSISDLTKSLPRMMASGQKKSGFGIQVDYDFVDMLSKITPKQEATGEPQKISLVFVLGALVPVSLCLTYLLVLLGFLTAPVGKGGLFSFTSGLSVLTSGYALAGAFYLGKAAEKSFQESLARAAEGLFGGIAKNFVPEVTVVPGTALYALAALSLVLFFSHRLLRNRA